MGLAFNLEILFCFVYFFSKLCPSDSLCSWNAFYLLLLFYTYPWIRLCVSDLWVLDLQFFIFVLDLLCFWASVKCSLSALPLLHCAIFNLFINSVVIFVFWIFMSMPMPYCRDICPTIWDNICKSWPNIQYIQKSFIFITVYTAYADWGWPVGTLDFGMESGIGKLYP